MKNDLSLELAKRLSNIVNQSFVDGEMFEKVTPITAELLHFWFCEPFINERKFNFHEGQRQAILNIIYLHEVLQIENVLGIYEQVIPELMPQADLFSLSQPKYSFPKYAVKMATGTGKTWVMHALLLWQILNARHTETNENRYTKNFLIVAPGLVVYDRLQDAFKGRLKENGGNERNPKTNDFYVFQELFIPPAYRDEVFGFLQNNVVSKEDGIGRKVTGDGLIALTNWHLFLSNDNEENDDNSNIISDLLPARPGTAAGNALDSLDARYLRGNELDFLVSLSNLMVINDEAHHIHEVRVEGEAEEVEWQKGLDFISKNKDLFCQIDFSATPYVTTGSGKKTTKQYFPHIIVDFDLATAMKKGLVKTLLLDKRQELTELESLDYKAVRDDRNKVVDLSEGQRLMLRAGLTKLKILENGFAKINEEKRPKMMVICEDTSVSPFVVDFLKAEGLDNDDVLSIDSDKKGEVKPADWLKIKEKLFNVDKYPQPKVIVSVLMLREGFDVNNICVIVPLRASTASILLEQTIGRGLRLMWREPEYQEEKEENRRKVLVKKEKPQSYIDMLSIIEHPKFQQFYDDLMNEGLAGIDEGDLGSGSNVTGDLIKVGLKPDYEQYDIFWPMVIRDAEEEMVHTQIDVSELEPFNYYSLEQLQSFLATYGEIFYSQAIISETTFGKYEVKADLFTAKSYNEYLQKMLRTITGRINRVGGKAIPMLQINEAEIVAAMDSYIRTRLFSQVFDPFSGSNWKILLSKNGIVTQHIIKVMSCAIHQLQENVMSSDAEVQKIWFSSIDTLRMRKTYSLELQKVIYERLPYPSNKGNLERKFMLFVDKDSDVESFIKINESQHSFATVFYIREDGLLASYHPDFLVVTKNNVTIVETKGDDKKNDENVKRKQKSIVDWCRKINKLIPEYRMKREWEYILLAESDFYTWSENGASFTDVANYTKISATALSGEFDFGQ